MIAATPSPPVAYLWEPFSPLHRPGICAARFPLWFTYVCADNADRYEGPIRDMLSFRYRWRAELRVVRTPKDVGRMLRDGARFRSFRARGARPLLKDPIAVFSSEWIADALGSQVVVLIRHPAAFVDSIKRRELRHPFEHFARQPALVRDLLSPFAEEIRAYAAGDRSLLDQGILLWNLIHHAIRRFHDRRRDWLFVRLEDLARDPIPRFAELYRFLDLTFDARVEATIAEHSSASNPVATHDMASRKRNSAAAVEAWRRHLRPSEVDEIRGRVEPIATAFYSDEDW
jgi:hypothetical protein